MHDSQASLVLAADEVHSGLCLGGKILALAALGQAGLPVPPWFAVCPEAMSVCLDEAQQVRLARATEAATVLELLAELRPAEILERLLAEHLGCICPAGQSVAVRSSAADEDGAQHSFAGQLDSFLFVGPGELAATVVKVWRSGFSERVLAYRELNGLPLIPRPPAVLVQRMIDAEAAGVAFGADPVSGRRGIAVVAAVLGVGTSLVSGECDADTFHVNRNGEIVLRQIADKVTRHGIDASAEEGVSVLAVPERLQRQPALGDDQVRDVADLARRCGRHFGRPQDIEWACEGGCLYLLQSRPITSLAALADPDAPLQIWDNSNIVESYSGVTTPLTFSFARRAYESVYREFCRILSVPEKRVEASDRVFACMLGLVRGRVYYNLLNWYRVLALLPGFTVNRKFMEQMMGVGEGLPDEIARELQNSTRGERLYDLLAAVRMVAGIGWSHLRLDAIIREFYARLKTALAPVEVPPTEMNLGELANYYLALEDRLLRRWDAPLINDFLAMIFYGTLRGLCGKWCKDTEGTLQNDLLCDQGGMISAEPAMRIHRMATRTNRPEMGRTLTEGSLSDIRAALDEAPELNREFAEYLEIFGDRCLEELKLETETLRDNPLQLYRSVGQLALRYAEGFSPAQGVERQIREAAETRASKALRLRPLRRLLFGWVLRNARARVRDRENLRFERTRVFGRVRVIFLEMGRRLHAIDALAEPRDIFYLRVEEVLDVVQGTLVGADLRAVVALRKAEFAQYRESENPANRIQTRGLLLQPLPARDEAHEATAATTDDPEERRGIGCCPGRVRARVNVVRNPKEAEIRRGEILVAERTDPGWIMLFPSSVGVLVERGSLLSHSAIVSRELGIPSIVAIPGLMHWLKSGDWVEMDGREGTVRRVGAPSEVLQ